MVMVTSWETQLLALSATFCVGVIFRGGVRDLQGDR